LQLVPASAPLAPDVRWRELASKFELLPASIFRAACSAAAAAATRPTAADGLRAIAQRDLVVAAEELSRRLEGRGRGGSALYN
jgi:hypothetical protein